MKNKLISICIALVFLFTSTICVNAIAPTPKIELNDYQLTVTDTNSVYVSGTVNISKGQMIGLYDSTCNYLYAYTKVGDSNSSSSFKIQIPSMYLTNDKNTFKVKSLPIRGVLNGSNPKTINVLVTSNKKTQTITASNMSLKVGEKKNINAKVTSGLPLTYKSNNANIATVDSKGVVVARKEGSTKVTISQSGNSEYKSVSKSITITVTKSQPAETISGISYYQFSDVNKTYKLNCKSSLGKITYKSNKPKVVSVDSSGKLTAKSPGTATIVASVKGKTKSITVKVPSIRGRVAALAPWRDTLVDTFGYINGRKYSFGKPGKYWETNGKWNGKTGKNGNTQSCLTLPVVSLKRVGILGKNSKTFWFADGNDGTKPNSTVKKLAKSPYMTVTYPHKSLKSLMSSGKVQYGDILCRSGHIFIYMGRSKSDRSIYQSGSTRSIGNGTTVTWGHGKGGVAKPKTAKITKQIKKSDALLKKYPASHFTGQKAGGSNYKSKIHIVGHINTYTVKTTCINGTITPSNLYMTCQNIPIKYNPVGNKKLKSIKVDGKSVDIKTYKNSYTFKKISKNHTIEVIYE